MPPTVAVQSYQGLLVQRFFLGVTEVGVTPAFSLITAMWYKYQEQPLRYAIWYSAVGIGTLVGALALYDIGQIHGALGFLALYVHDYWMRNFHVGNLLMAHFAGQSSYGEVSVVGDEICCGREDEIQADWN